MGVGSVVPGEREHALSGLVTHRLQRVLPSLPPSPHGSTRITDMCPAMASFLHGHSCPMLACCGLYMLGHLPGSRPQSREVVFVVL